MQSEFKMKPRHILLLFAILTSAIAAIDIYSDFLTLGMSTYSGSEMATVGGTVHISDFRCEFNIPIRLNIAPSVLNAMNCTAIFVLFNSILLAQICIYKFLKRIWYKQQKAEQKH